MMTSWFTQNADGTHSYYQYDNDTQKYCQIDLTSKPLNVNTDGLVVDVKPDCIVGFANREIIRSNLKIKDGQFFYGDKALNTRPSPGDYAYQWNLIDAQINAMEVGLEVDWLGGQPVINARDITRVPVSNEVPAGIVTKDIMLLANDGMINGRKEYPIFEEVTPDSISNLIQDSAETVIEQTGRVGVTALDVLKLQAGELLIQKSRIQESKLVQGVEQAKNACSKIINDLNDGIFAPNDALVTSVENMTDAFKEMDGTNKSEALETITSAKEALEESYKLISEHTGNKLRQQCQETYDALNNAERSASQLHEIERGYDMMRDANTIDEYIDGFELSNEPEPEPVPEIIPENGPLG